MTRLPSGLLRQFLGLILAIILILSGWQIATILANIQSWIYWTGIIFLLILGVLAGWLSGLFESDFNITINIPEKRKTGCRLPVTVFLISLAFITIYVMFLNETDRNLILTRAIEIIQYSLESAGEFLINLSQQIENLLSIWLFLPFFAWTIGLL